MTDEAWSDRVAILALRELRRRTAIVRDRPDIFFADRPLADLEEAIRDATFLRDRPRFEAALVAYDRYVTQRMRAAVPPVG